MPAVTYALTRVKERKREGGKRERGGGECTSTTMGDYDTARSQKLKRGPLEGGLSAGRAQQL